MHKDRCRDKYLRYIKKHYNPNVEEYILTTGKGLGRVSDQIVEACHSALNKRLMKSNYWVKDVESSQHGKKFYKGILHFNSYNIGS